MIRNYKENFDITFENILPICDNIRKQFGMYNSTDFDSIKFIKNNGIYYIYKDNNPIKLDLKPKVKISEGTSGAIYYQEILGETTQQLENLEQIKQIYQNTQVKPGYKIFLKSSLTSIILEEITILQQNKYKNINKVNNVLPIKIGEPDKSILMAGASGDLYDLVEHRGTTLTINQIRQIMLTTVRCIIGLNKYNIWYYDIKLENMLYRCVDKKIEIFLGDIGSIIPFWNNDYPITYIPASANNPNDDDISFLPLNQDISLYKQKYQVYGFIRMAEYLAYFSKMVTDHVNKIGLKYSDSGRPILQDQYLNNTEYDFIKKYADKINIDEMGSIEEYLNNIIELKLFNFLDNLTKSKQHLSIDIYLDTFTNDANHIWKWVDFNDQIKTYQSITNQPNSNFLGLPKEYSDLLIEFYNETIL